MQESVVKLRTTPQRTDGRVGLILLASGTILLGQAMAAWIRSDGTPFLPFFIPAFALLALGVAVGPSFERRFRVADLDRVLLAVLAVGIAWSTFTILTSPHALPVPTHDAGLMSWVYVRTFVVLSGIVGLSGLAVRPVLGRLHLPVLIGLTLSLGLWVVATTHWPWIDVFFFERDAGIRLGQLINPYSGSITNIYQSTQWYGEAFATVDRVLSGYPYPPVSLLVTSAGQLLGDEPRIGLVVAVGAAGGLIGWIRRDPLGRGAAALLMLTPSLLYVLHYAFTEPVAIALLAATAAAAVRSPRSTALCLGLFLFAKQYCLIAIPLIPLLLRAGTPRREVLRFALTALAVALVVVIPFLAWDPVTFFRTTIEYHFATPFRAESLGFGPMIADAFGTLPIWITGGATLVALLLVIWRAPWTPSGFAAATGFLLLTLSAFAKIAFPNYYLLVVGAMCVSIAAARPAEEPGTL